MDYCYTCTQLFAPWRSPDDNPIGKQVALGHDWVYTCCDGCGYGKFDRTGRKVREMVAQEQGRLL